MSPDHIFSDCPRRFQKIKRQLQMHLSDEVFNVVQGNTDSEWAFALFLSKVCLRQLLYRKARLRSPQQLQNPNAKTFTTNELKKAMLDTIAQLNEFADERHIAEVC